MENQEEPKGRILVVDDEPEVRTVLCALLSMKEYTVHAAGNGQEALSVLKAVEADVALIDLCIPGMADGFELLEAVQTTYPQTAVIMMTGAPSREIGIRALKTGAVDYIAKPFNLDAILIKLQRARQMRHL